MTENHKKSPSIFTKGFRFNKRIISISIPTNNNNLSTTISALCSFIGTIDSIDQLVQLVENNSTKQQYNSFYGQISINIEQIEEILIKWTHIAHFLLDTYQKLE